jgi:hypothetical protein
MPALGRLVSNFVGEFYLTLEELNGTAPDSDAIAKVLAPQLTAAQRYLPRKQMRFPKPSRPVWDQGAMGRSRNRVFGNSLGRREEARDEIAALPRSSRDNGKTIESRDLCHVGPELPHLVFCLKNAKVIARCQDLSRPPAKSRYQCRINFAFFRQA